MLVDGRSVVNFAGMHYLALTSAPELRAAALAALDANAGYSEALSSAYGIPCPEIEALEAAGAAFFGTPASVFFPSGYLVGLVGLAALKGSYELVLIDSLAHWNLRDAAHASGAPVHEFRHADADDLRHNIEKLCAHGARPLILTDAVFATTGRVPDLPAYERLAQHYGGALFLDESHGYGVLGRHGRGANEHCGLTTAMHAGTLSKAFCAFGAILPCDKSIAERLRMQPPLRGTASGSPIIAAVGAAALNLARADLARIAKVQLLAQRLHEALSRLGLEVTPTPAPIAAFAVGDRKATAALQAQLFTDGVYVLHSNYIGAGEGGLIRCAVFADHEPEDIDILANALRRRL